MDVEAKMDDTFRRVGTADIPPIEIWVVHGDRINLDIKDDQDARVSLTVRQARELRDWLTQALPCDHVMGWSSPLQKSVCNRCGSTFSGEADVQR